MFVISDFLSEEPSWHDSMARLARRHDVLAIQIADMAERELPHGMGMIALQDAETGEQILLDGNDASFRQCFADAASQRQAAIQQAFSRSGCAHLPLLTDQALDAQLIQFMRMRKKQSQQPKAAVSEPQNA